ncbi:hypothetical protein [Luteibacter aegosomatissinici]|uniref:hypothetical protein n=1 Tax=Luteibacter aegosomatissinici TaxID=2911539 RepID=UPI001FFA1354|nr:hypothetical protein [Luteibacter aegosomatissinici]UPG92863.1 hypothetical protein L2Y97_13410 [Luteibacter aegosomatissinici]
MKDPFYPMQISRQGIGGNGEAGNLPHKRKMSHAFFSEVLLKSPGLLPKAYLGSPSRIPDMTINTSNITAGTSLSVSVSGTAYLQRSAQAGVLPGVLPRQSDEVVDQDGKETPSQALARVPQSTRDAIEEALKKVDPNASLDTYEDGTSYSGNAGLILHLIA